MNNNSCNNIVESSQSIRIVNLKGYLMCCALDWSTPKKKSDESKKWFNKQLKKTNKACTEEELYDVIAQVLKKRLPNNVPHDWNYVLETLNYNGDYLRTKQIRNLLLLVNVLTCNECNPSLPFPFDKYCSSENEWHIEHIHAKNAESDSNCGEWIDNICNLTLLDCHTNTCAEYSNKDFETKRNFIENQAKTDKFILPCTLNIFRGVYTNNSTKIMDSWDKDGREAYKSSMKELLESYIKL